MKTSLWFVLVLAACGSDDPAKADASGNGSGSGSGSGSGALIDCASYCGTITSACGGSNKQYDSAATCMASCSDYPVGASGEQSGDTLQCRGYHANAAVADPGTHCVHAGPSGAGVCGTPCQGFCDLVTAECPTQYPAAGTCATTCANFATTPPYNATITSGNSLSCRIYHATAASTDPGTHCAHTTMTSPPCS